jgi:hypothetical protein
VATSTESEGADSIVIIPLEALPPPTPETTFTDPPVREYESPDLTVKSAPGPSTELPTVSSISPALDSASPVSKEMLPDDLIASPELNINNPELVTVLEAELKVTEPLRPVILEPDTKLKPPPSPVCEEPADIRISPAKSSAAPAVISILPPLPITPPKETCPKPLPAVKWMSPPLPPFTTPPALSMPLTSTLALPLDRITSASGADFNDIFPAEINSANSEFNIKLYFKNSPLRVIVDPIPQLIKNQLRLANYAILPIILTFPPPKTGSDSIDMSPTTTWSANG